MDAIPRRFGGDTRSIRNLEEAALRLRGVRGSGSGQASEHPGDLRRLVWGRWRGGVARL